MAIMLNMVTATKQIALIIDTLKLSLLSCMEEGYCASLH